MSFKYSKPPWPRGSVRGYTCEGLGFESWGTYYLSFFVLFCLFVVVVLLLLFFFSNKKNRNEEHKGFCMIYVCDKKCQTAIFGQRR